MKRYPWLAAVLLITAAWAAPCRPPSPATRAQIHARVSQLLANAHVPGLELGIACDGRLVVDQGYGLRDIGRKLPVMPDTRFQIGSITKQFTAAAILQLRDAGKLSLNDPVSRFLPDFPYARQITLRELLNQTTGLYNYTDAPHFIAYTGQHPGNFSAITALLRGHTLAFAPGSKWQYSNTNYIVLGQVVARASGEPYAAYLRTHIFAPARMQDSGLIGQAQTDLAVGYNVSKGEAEIAPPLPEAWADSAGAIISTVADLERWDTAVSNGIVIPRADYAEMTTAGRLADGHADQYGFGWMLGRYGNQPTVWHNGGTFGFLALNARLPESGLDIIVLTNSTSLAPWNVAHAVLHVIAPMQATAAAPGEDAAITARVRQAVGWAVAGDFDRSAFTPRMNAALTPATVSGLAAQMQTLGKLQSLVFRGKQTVQGQTVYAYLARFANGGMNVTYVLDAQGKISGLLFRPAE